MNIIFPKSQYHFALTTQLDKGYYARTEKIIFVLYTEVRNLESTTKNLESWISSGTKENVELTAIHWYPLALLFSSEQYQQCARTA